jgi:hypothetical protein
MQEVEYTDEPDQLKHHNWTWYIVTGVGLLDVFFSVAGLFLYIKSRKDKARWKTANDWPGHTGGRDTRQAPFEYFDGRFRSHDTLVGLGIMEDKV